MTRRLLLITVAWLLAALGISTGLMAAISPWVNRINPCIDYYAAHPEGWCEAPVVMAIDAILGVGTLVILLAPLLWVYARAGYGWWEPEKA